MDDPIPTTLKGLVDAETSCRRCPLYRDATQVVPGEGPRRARMLLVGEQPGDQEDRQGRPFVGPAGRVLDRALAEAGIDRQTVFVTNAVKHFKFEQRGKRRLHKKPNAHEIERCHWWLDIEKAIVRPPVIVALGATAARSLMGRPVTLAKLRGAPVAAPDGSRVVVTIHPSYLLRIRAAEDKAREYAGFLADLKLGARLLADAA
ncbi:UdgX family uracil-DNA binding protein [Xanthobacteraceae bacterium Astr-EGSB]|uniref:UdgX family uracil-DNA binding protein n=1 Tax=Astrobacterium formosum TaxID=3069710 RepID=UPI0027B68346|nr:UdgX family uracil-DNA binding protein [Xanthobacteraceae bacterium Astr-EGSB]